jgi:hypothetical protein
MSIPAEELFDAIAADVNTALDRVGGVIVDAVKQDVSIPVEITTGPRGGKVIIRSKPGEHPRLETGKLQAGMGHEVFIDGSDSTLSINGVVDYAQYLDPGMNRPILTGVDERFGDDVLDAIAAAIEGK